MRPHADRDGLITVGANDTRITTEGRLLRKYKLDELPQLLNILKGEMSFVGPRPEVRKYVELYNSEQRKGSIGTTRIDRSGFG
jgi:lipopolysaccharide/colanic/teichoic acid biosynthesis glycosyltransferase